MVAIFYPVILTSALLLCAYLYSPNIHTHNQKETIIKYILLWTNPMLAPLNYLGHGFDAFTKNNCEYTNCYVTHNVSDLGGVLQFDAIVFNGRHLPKMHWPRYRFSNQKYVYANMESAQNFPECDRRLNGFFNWTWTYKLDSDSRWGYITVCDLSGRVVGPKTDMHWLEMEPVDSHTKLRLKTKSIAAAWFVSNCKTKSLRERFAKNIAKELHYYNLTLHVYGSCGTHECPKQESKCGEILEKDYYFYFAFENSLSEDYVTEKVLTAMSQYTVPVVFGGANYSRFLPPGSYLDARELGAERLAARMANIIENHRNGNASLYHDFFRWRNHYTFKSTADTEDVCNICRLLNDPAAVSRDTVYEHFLQWWNTPYRSRRPPRWNGNPEYFGTFIQDCPETANPNLDVRAWWDTEEGQRCGACDPVQCDLGFAGRRVACNCPDGPASGGGLHTAWRTPFLPVGLRFFTQKGASSSAWQSALQSTA